MNARSVRLNAPVLADSGHWVPASTETKGMAVASRRAEQRQMVIRVAIEKIDPLAGSATSEDGVELAFHGWLGLLNAFTELLHPETPADRRGKAPAMDPAGSD